MHKGESTYKYIVRIFALPNSKNITIWEGVNTHADIDSKYYTEYKCIYDNAVNWGDLLHRSMHIYALTLSCTSINCKGYENISDVISEYPEIVCI